jgi:outer membrane protein insertion porin family
VQEDLERLRELYQEFGYFRAIIHQPETSVRGTEPWVTIPGIWKPGKAIDMRIRIEEGSRYRMGRLELKSVSGKLEDLFFQADFLKAAFSLREGDIFNVTKIRKSLEDYRKLYSEFGFINFTPIPETDIDDQARVINFTLEFDPGKQFFVHRIDFVGNTTTRDKVIRRELLLDEGSMFNSRFWELSILRLNQLGYFEELSPESADVQQNAEQGTVDLTLKVKEKGRNSIGLTGGASGVLGSFIGLNYSTNNFLGLGETLNFDVEWGDRQRVFLFGFTEPYLFDRPIQSGFTFFVREFEFDQARQVALATGQAVVSGEQFVNYVQDSIGFSVFSSYPMKRWRFTRVGISYSFDNTDITCSTRSCNELFEQLAFRSIGGQDALQGIVSSRVTPTFLYNTVNHPMFPTSGTSLFVGGTWEGLGGNQKSIRPSFEIKHFRPINHRRNTLAFRLLGAFVTGYGGLVPSPASRFYVGGEDTVRGFDVRSVTPLAFVPTTGTRPVFWRDPTVLDPSGNPTLRISSVDVLADVVTFPGGDSQLVGNFEYRIPIAGPVSVSYFFDVGISAALRPSQLRLHPEQVEALQAQFPTATISDTLELVPGTNGKVRTSTGIEFVVNLPVVNAPFRIYWAYNLTRLETVVVSSVTAVQPSSGFTFPPGVFENQILPQIQGRAFFTFDEPAKAIRFTISRTF